MGNLRVSRKSLMILIAVAAVLLAGNLVAYVVGSGSYRQARAELTSRESQVENSKKVALRLQESERKYMEVQSRLTTLERSVSERAYIPTMLKQLEISGRKVQLRVLGVRPVSQAAERKTSTSSSSADSEGGAGGKGGDGAASDKPAAKTAEDKAPKPYDTLAIEVKVLGSYFNTMRFLDELNRFPKIVAVTGMEMKPGNMLSRVTVNSFNRKVTVSGVRKLNVTLNLSAFVFPADKGPLPAMAGPAPSITIEPVPPVSKPRPVRVGKKNWRSRNEAG